MVLLAGDVGGTTTRLGLFEHAPRRPKVVAVRTYRNSDFSSFCEVLDAFTKDANASVVAGTRIESAVAGVAGPVAGGTARLTNIAWNVSAADIARRIGTPRVRLLNDLEALALGATVLGPEAVVQIDHWAQRRS